LDGQHRSGEGEAYDIADNNQKAGAPKRTAAAVEVRRGGCSFAFSMPIRNNTTNPGPMQHDVQENGGRHHAKCNKLDVGPTHVVEAPKCPALGLARRRKDIPKNDRTPAEYQEHAKEKCVEPKVDFRLRNFLRHHSVLPQSEVKFSWVSVSIT